MAKKNYMDILPTFPPNVPLALIAVYREIVQQYQDKGGYQRKLARRLGVNMKYLNDLLVRGIEPTSKTVKGREARERLFLKNVAALENKEEVIQVLQKIVASLEDTIRRLNG